MACWPLTLSGRKLVASPKRRHDRSVVITQDLHSILQTRNQLLASMLLFSVARLARQVHYQLTMTGVPTATLSYRSTMSRLCIRMQP